MTRCRMVACIWATDWYFFGQDGKSLASHWTLQIPGLNMNIVLGRMDRFLLAELATM